MSRIPTGTELARPFMPTKDFDLSKRFYETLGNRGVRQRHGISRPFCERPKTCSQSPGKGT